MNPTPKIEADKERRQLEEFIHSIEVNNRMFADDMDKSEEYEDNKFYLIEQLLAWRDKACVAELEKLEKHREFIYWGDGSPSDLDSYIKDRLNQLGAKDE